MAVADPTWVQSTIATRHGMCDLCVVYNIFMKVFISPGGPEVHTCCSPLLLNYNNNNYTEKQTNKKDMKNVLLD